MLSRLSALGPLQTDPHLCEQAGSSGAFRRRGQRSPLKWFLTHFHNQAVFCARDGL